MALTTFADDWGKVYNKAAVVFAKDIKAAQKVDRSQGNAVKLLLDDAQSTGAVTAAMIEIDKADLAAGSAKDLEKLPANIKLFKAGLKKLEDNKKKYVAVLEATQKSKPTIKDKNNYNMPTAMKEAFPDSFRQLKLLQTEIEAIYARAVNALHGAETTSEKDKIEAEKNKAKAKVQGGDEAANAKLKEIGDEAAMKQFLIAFAPSFKSSMAKGAAVIQRIKSSPDVATYNTEMNNGGRDISQNLVNVGKLKNNPKFKSTSLAKKLPDPGPLTQEITPFANGAKRNLPLTSSPDEVKVALTEFTALFKKIATTYADIIAGKVK